jgi:hypothetical protein
MNMPMSRRFTGTFSNMACLDVSSIDFANMEELSVDPQQVLPSLSFGRVDAESDDRLGSCFVGTELLRNVLLPQHSLLVGGKGSGKSAMFRLLVDDLHKIRPLLPKDYDEIYCIPAHGLQSDEYLAGNELRELNPQTVDDFRYFWLLYLGLKTASTLVQDEKMKTIVAKTNKERLKSTFATLTKIVEDVGLMQEKSTPARLKQRIEEWVKPAPALPQNGQSYDVGKVLTFSFRQKTGMSIISLLDLIDTLLQDSNSLAWLMLDKLDLLYIGDVEKLKISITGLVQLLVEYSSRFKNIHFKMFLRTDIYRQLHIVNKSHLVSYTTEMKWRGQLLLKLFISRAVSNQTVQTYCEELLGEKVDVTTVIMGDDAYVQRVFYTIFEPTMGNGGPKDAERPQTHDWILKRLIDGLGISFPRELIHLGNLAAAKQREMNRSEGRHMSTRLISSAAVKEAFKEVSEYRCDTYLYSEFPHLAKHFDVFRGSDSSTFHREELYMLFEPLTPKGDDAIRAVHDAGLLTPLGRNVDSSAKFKIPLLYKTGLGISDRRAKLPKPRASEDAGQQHANAERMQ